MKKDSFRYPGNDLHRFRELLGLLAQGGVGNHVVIQPEQWSHSKCYGVVRLAKLQHYLEVALHMPDGSVAFSYRDFCFGIQDDRFGNVRKECAQTICEHAHVVADRVQFLFPNANVQVFLEPEPAKT